MTKEYFIEKAVKIHGIKYDYSKVTDCKKRDKVCIICPEHGEFWQTPEHHFQGHGCPKCGKKKMHDKDTKLKYSKEDFIQMAKNTHGERYDYSKVEYSGMRKSKVCIICPEHGEFWQLPYSHLMGHGCPKCKATRASKLLKRDEEDFLNQAKKVHGDKYDYSKIEYANNVTKICIICPEHGEFWQTPKHHLCGQGCPKCAGVYKSNTNDFIEKARKIHGDKYDYSKVRYVNAVTKVCIICPEHGEFWIKPNNHLCGQGCSECGIVSRGLLSRSNTSQFIEKARKIHGGKYDYSKVDYIKNSEKVCIICPEHGEFWQTPREHLSGYGCAKCKTSYLEKELINCFEKAGISYQYEKRFSWLGRKSLDFYLPQYHVAIECQGEQHYKPIKYFGGADKFQKTILRDQKKKEECESHGVKLLYFTHENTSFPNTFHETEGLLHALIFKM